MSRQSGHIRQDTHTNRHARTLTQMQKKLRLFLPCFDLWCLLLVGLSFFFFFFSNFSGKMNREPPVIYAWDMWRVYSLSHCCSVHFLVCREKTGFFEHSDSPINYCTIVNVSQKRCRWEVCGRLCACVWLLRLLFGMFVKWWNAARHAVLTCRQSWMDFNKKAPKL